MADTLEKGLVQIDADFEDMLICALRYAVGRKTYVTWACSSFVKPLIPKLSDRTIGVINRDFGEYDRNVRVGLWSWGDDCDKEAWLDLWNSVKAEVAKRLKEQN